LGLPVIVLMSANAGERVRRFSRTRVRVVDGVEIVDLGFPFIFRRFRDRWLERSIAARLRAAAGLDTPTVIHVHERTRPLVVRPLTHLPLVWTNHSSMFLSDFDDAGKRASLVRVLGSCDWITVPSRELGEKTVALGYPEERVTYIPNGVDLQEFRPGVTDQPRHLRIGSSVERLSRETCVVLCARRFVPKNGIHHYLDVIDSLGPDDLQRCVFLFAGNSPHAPRQYAADLSMRISRLSGKARCHDLGSIPNDRMPELYSIADISVLPSLLEATSITGLESMASGLPIVGTRAGGIPEIVLHGSTGLLSPVDDWRGFGSNLRELIRNEVVRRAMGEAARRRAEEHFGWGSIAGSFVTVYEEAFRHAAGTSPGASESHVAR